MTHDQLAEKIAAHLAATGVKHDGHAPHVWKGDHLSRIYWGRGTCVEIDSRAQVSNWRSGRYTAPPSLKETVEKAKTLVLGRGW